MSTRTWMRLFLLKPVSPLKLVLGTGISWVLGTPGVGNLHRVRCHNTGGVWWFANSAGLDPLWLLRAFRRCLPLGRHGM